MADDTTPAWGSTTLTPSSRPASTESGRSTRSQPTRHTDEQTPLLSRRDSIEHERPTSSSSSFLRSQSSKSVFKGRRWPSLLALLLLCIAVIMIMILGFVFPNKIQEYAMQAMVFEPTSLSIDSFTETGVRARVQGIFRMDPSRVEKKSVRDIGKFGTWIAREVESGRTKAEVYLPEYGNILLGTATVPGMKLDIRPGHHSRIDMVADVQPGDFEGIREVARDFMDGKLEGLKVSGKATVAIKSGLIRLPEQTVTQDVVFQGSDVPTLPAHNITRINVHEVDLPDGRKGMQADVSVTVENPYPVDFVVPTMGFGILVDNCQPGDPHIMVADAASPQLHIQPKQNLHLNVSGVVRKLPEALTQACPGSQKSPLDAFVGDYIHGEDTTVYVRGSDSPSLDTPKWITDLVSGITIPISLAGKEAGSMVKNFSMTDVHCSLPNPFAEPGSADGYPKVSAMVNVLVALPDMINFPIDVSGIRADADMYYKGKKLGRLDLTKWQKASAKNTKDGLEVQSKVDDAPLEITDNDLFSDVVQAMLFGSKPVIMEMRAEVDVKMVTALGEFAIKGVPATGKVPVKPISRPGNGDDKKPGFPHIMPKVSELQIVDTTPDSMTIEATVNVTNPTNYSATIPFVDILVSNNGSVIGHAIMENQTVKAGVNEGVIGKIVWKPAEGGDKGRVIGRELLSQVISGYNATLTLQTYAGTLPSQPGFGRALSAFNFTIPFPKIHAPSKPSDPSKPGKEDPGMHLIKSATMHLLTRTAVFTLSSPFRKTTLYITNMNATSFYKPEDGSDMQPVGHINYQYPFPVPPGESESPHIPVEFAGGLGYEALRKALGGELKLNAKGTAGVRVGQWDESLWIETGGIGAKVRL